MKTFSRCRLLAAARTYLLPAFASASREVSGQRHMKKLLTGDKAAANADFHRRLETKKSAFTGYPLAEAELKLTFQFDETGAS